MAIAEIIRRDQHLLFRVGFGEDGHKLEPDAELELPAGTFVFVEPMGDGTARLARDDGGNPRVIAAADSALAGVYRIAVRAGLRLTYPDEVLAEVRALADAPGIDDPSLVDLTAVPFVTIDYAESQDLDQALFVDVDPDDHSGWRVDYALADAAHFVAPDSALFAEAIARGTSYYLPGLVVPMLPAALSEDLVSLRAGVDRRALVFRVRVSADGVAGPTQLVRARIRSRAKLSYDGVQAFIDDPAARPIDDDAVAASLHRLGQVGRARAGLAERRDVIEYDRVSLRLGLPGPDAPELALDAERRNAVQSWNEQVSLLTNIEGARFLTATADGHAVPGLFKVHPPPTPEALGELASSIDELVDDLGLDGAWRWRRDEGESLADYVERLPDDGPGARLARALQRQSMLIGQQSFFATEPAPHFGIGAAAYSRFSSPMREIVGVVTDHIALARLAGAALPDGLDAAVIEAAADAGNRANATQKRITRQAVKLAMDELFAGELDTPMADRPRRTGTVLGVTPAKLYVQLDDPPVEVKLYVPDQERLLGVRVAVRGRFAVAVDGRVLRVGDAVRLCLREYDRHLDRWVLVVEPPAP